MLERGLRRLYGRLGSRYPSVFVAASLQASWLIAAATVAFLHLYVPMDGTEAVAFLALTLAITGISILLAAWRAHRLLAPMRRWLDGERGQESGVAAWRCAVGLQLRFWRHGWGLVPFLTCALPMAVGTVVLLDGSWLEAVFVLAVVGVAIAYAAILNLFVTEVGMRPLTTEIAASLPEDAGFGRLMLPLRLKLVGVLPMINLIAGLLAAGLASPKREVSALGLDVLGAVVATFVVSLSLTLLLARSLRQPLREMLESTNRVRGGDLDERVPVTSSDEIGELASAFNQMVAGLRERERIRSTLGTYLDPTIAEQLVEDDASPEGEEVEASILVLDVRDFTVFAESHSPREVVSALNRLFELVVPIIDQHGGLVDKFIGDGLLTVFGVPVRHDDHADRALEAALEVVESLDQPSGDGLAVGIGISSGEVLVGTVGGGGRLDFTAIGDTVNVAAHVEAATRLSGDPILLSESTKRLLRRPQVELAERPAIDAKGRRNRLALYAPQPRHSEG